MKHLKTFEQFSQNSNEELKSVDLPSQFRDKNGKNPKVKDLITDETGLVGQVKAFYMQDNKHTTNHPMMTVDFRSHYVDLNPSSEFEILEEPSEDVLKSFEH